MFWLLAIDFLHLLLPSGEVVSHLFLTITLLIVSASLEIDNQIFFLPHAVVRPSGSSRGILRGRSRVVVGIDSALVEQNQLC